MVAGKPRGPTAISPTWGSSQGEPPPRVRSCGPFSRRSPRRRKQGWPGCPARGVDRMAATCSSNGVFEMSSGQTFAFALLSCGAVSASACTNSLDLDRFHQAASGTSVMGGSVTYSDLDFVARSMRPHIGEYFEVRIV